MYPIWWKGKWSSNVSVSASSLFIRHLVCMGIKRWGCKHENPGCRNCSSSLTPAWIGSLWSQSSKLVECWVLSFSLISGAGTHISFSQRTFELRSCPAKTPAGTSSSPATAKMGTGIALGGVTGTASGKVYIFEARNAAHCSLTKVSDSSSRHGFVLFGCQRGRTGKTVYDRTDLTLPGYSSIEIPLISHSLFYQMVQLLDSHRTEYIT